MHKVCQPHIITQPVTLRKKMYNFYKEYTVDKKKNN